jgi:hypothetical protein
MSQLSDCCHMQVATCGGTTRCSECGKPCDIWAPPQRTFDQIGKDVARARRDRRRQ